jgi:protein SCO1/2
MKASRLGIYLCGWLLLAASSVSSSPAPAAKVSLSPPADLNARAGFDQRIGATLAMGTAVRNADGHTETLAGIAAGKPLLMAFGYYHCPNLCDITLHGMASAAAQMPLRAGDDYRVVFLSIDPKETPVDAHEAQDMLAGMAPRAGVSTWTFATGIPADITSITQTVGFRYFLDPRNGQYAHPAGVIVITPDGRVAQYFYGASYDPNALRLALVDASGGKLGSVIDRLVLLCCGYDPATGRYSLLISRLMIALGCAFVAAFALGLVWLRRRSP